MRSSLIDGMFLILLLFAGGCVLSESEQVTKEAPIKIDTFAIKKTLLVDQKAVYPELRDGKYLFLVDFEPYGPLEVDKQVSCFSLEGVRANDGVGPNSKRELTGVLQRTGSGALKVTLDPHTALAYHFPRKDIVPIPGEDDKSAGGIGSNAFAGTGRKFTLLSMAILSGNMRDDLRVTLVSGGKQWTSGPTLLRRGWNQVLIDIQRLDQLADFDAQDIRVIRLNFIKSASPTTFTLDDIVLIDNNARVIPAPQGLILMRKGLDYTIKLPSDERTVEIRQSEDGLWRLGSGQPVVKLLASNDGPEDYFGEGVAGRKKNYTNLSGEQLGPMGPNRVGQVKVEEHNPVRVRISNTWMFPSRAGRWAMTGIRHLRWIYTIYPDGRWITDIELNNAGGRPLGRISISLPDTPPAWANPKGGISKECVVTDFIGPSSKWSYMQVSEGENKGLLLQNYLKPARILTTLGRKGFFAPGDADRDGFDESQGCYYLGSVNGHCRFKIIPPPEGLLNPVFRIFGPWEDKPSVNREGLAVGKVSPLPDGSAVFLLKGKLLRPVYVEVFGKIREEQSGKKN